MVMNVGISCGGVPSDAEDRGEMVKGHSLHGWASTAVVEHTMIRRREQTLDCTMHQHLLRCQPLKSHTQDASRLWDGALKDSFALETACNVAKDV